MNVQRTVNRVAVLAAAFSLAACSNSAMQPPAGTTGTTGTPGSAGASLPGSGGSSSPSGTSSSSGAGSPGTAPSAAGSSAGSQPGTASAGGAAGTGAAGDPGAVFDKSLGDFDGEIGRERDAMAKSGQGSGRAAETRQESDSSSVRTAGGPNVSVSVPGMGGIGGIGVPGGIGAPGGIGGEPGGSTAGKGSSAGSGQAGTDQAGTGKGGDQGTGQAGDAGVGPDGEPGTPDDTGGSGTPTPDTAAVGGPAGAGGPGGAGDALPADIPPDGSGEDQVARQLREAALAEKDPAIRDALWNEYRKVMGIKKK